MKISIKNYLLYDNKVNLFFVAFWVFVFRITMDLAYVYVIYPNFKYYGFGCDFDFFRFILSWVLTVPFIFLLKKLYKREKLSDAIISVITIFAFIPCMSLYTYMKTPFIILLIVYYMVFFLAAYFIPVFSIPKISIKNQVKILYIISISLILLTVFIWAFYAKFHLQLSLFDVYETRLEAREYNIPVIFNYIRAMSRKVIPVLALYMLHTKKTGLFIALCVAQYLNFCIDASKSVLFSLVLGIAGYIIYSRFNKVTKYIPAAYSGFNIVGILSYLLFNFSGLINKFTRRLSYLPSLLNYFYYDYCKDFNPNFFAQGFLSILGVKSQFPTDIALIIGDKYFSDPATNANNGLFSDAYVNLGFAGMLLMPVLLVLALRFLDACAEGIPKRVLIVCLFDFSFAFIGSMFFTVMLTHGFVATCILLLFIPKEHEEKGHSLF